MRSNRNGDSIDGIGGMPYAEAPSLHRSEQAIILLFASLTMLVVLSVAVVALFLRERHDSACFQSALQQRAKITVRDTQLQDELDAQLGATLKALLNPKATAATKTKAVEDLSVVTADHQRQRAADDASRAKAKLTTHC